MTPAALAAYAAACFVLFVTPGPGMMTLTALTVRSGPARGVAYGAGVFTGDIVILAGVVLGLAAAAAAAGPAFVLFKLAAAGYLLVLGARSLHSAWRPPDVDAPARAPPQRALAGDFAAGVATPFANPKALLFYTAFVPAFFDVAAVGPGDFAAMAAVMAALAAVTIGIYVGGAHAARARLTDPRIMRSMHGVLGVLFVGMAILLATR